MSAIYVSSVGRKDLDKFIKYFCLKSTHIIVKGRSGQPVSTSCSSSSGGSEWFNLATTKSKSIDHEATAALCDGNPKDDNTYVVEISLRTSDAESLILEVWSVSLTNRCEDINIRHEVYNRLSLLLKSLLCLTRTTPAYKLSRRQGNEYVICYRVYMGKVILCGLGAGFRTLRVGAVATPIGTLTMSAAYRTNEYLHVSSSHIGNQSPIFNLPMDLQDDYFALSRPNNTTAARPCHAVQSRTRTLSETSDTQTTSAMENSPSYNLFSTSASNSPAGKLASKDAYRAMFIIGTPPSGQMLPHRTVSSPILARSNTEGNFPLTQYDGCSLHCGNHSSNCTKEFPSSFQNSTMKNIANPVTGSSAPSFQNLLTAKTSSVAHHTSGRRVSAPVVVPGSRTFSNSDKSTHKVKTDDPVESTSTTYCHWSNSNVTKITADKNTNNPSKKTVDEPRSTEWSSARHNSAAQGSFTAALPASEPGAFVLSEKVDSSSTTSSSKLPFLDLLSAMENDGSGNDNFSQHSDSDTSPDTTIEGADERMKKRSSCKRSLGRSSSSDSSKLSNDDSDLTENYLQDEFVLVDVNPAFARDDSIEDLGTFYRDCKNAQDLVMFEQHKDTEADETLLDLTKQLEDYETDIVDFDEFISKLSCE